MEQQDHENKKNEKKKINKKKKAPPKIEFDETSRKSFLLGLKNKKKRKEKKAKIIAKEILNKARAELRHKKKEKQQEDIKTLLRKQSKLGIQPLSIFTEGPNGINMEMIEVDPNEQNNLEEEEEEEQIE